MTTSYRDRWQSLVFAATTLLLFFSSLILVTNWRLDSEVPANLLLTHWMLFSAVNLVWIGVLYIFDLLTPSSYREPSWMRRFLIAMGSALALAVLIFYAQPDLVVTPRRILAFHTLLSFGSFFNVALIVSILQKRRAPYAILFVGADSPEQKKFTQIADQHHLNLRIDTYVPDASQNSFTHRYDAITFAPTTPPSAQVIIDLQRQLDAPIRSYTQLYESLLRRIPVTHLDQWEYTMPSGVGTASYALLKRFTDICSGVCLGLAFLLTAPLVIPAIKLTSPGPIFFTQRRITLQGTAFTIYKYRTMRADTPSDIWTSPKDPRITRIGHWLRRTHLDELPQAWNLLKGDLSLIGPRPEQEVLIDGLSEQIPFYLERHRIRCGLTGWAQLHVYAGTVEETRDKLEYDLYYVKHRSLMLDGEIALRTIRNFIRVDLYA